MSYSFMINGELTKPFVVAKGLRQGDPMSPFLFVIAMEYLSRLLRGLKQVKEYKFHPRCGKLNITHINFADDLLMFARGDSSSVQDLHDCFKQFSATSRLQANLTKSAIYFGGVTQTEQLSYAGRVKLVQTFIFGIQSYWAQLFIMLAKVMKLIEAYCRSYIWSGTNTITKRPLIAWDKMCLPKSARGYNLMNLQVWNKVAITIIHWDLAQKKEKTWIRWIHTYYIKGQSILEMNIPQQASWMVRKIIEARKIMQQMPEVKQTQSVIKQIYLGLLGSHNKVE
ncbi:uncharacterized protein LOC142162436 [Nicotiana tabacum]|uniref:Uncharacterized protein LOC142162436 n=1 Tax=Nicotiana tabacum TaxID=4097 RepID=A0AC58RQB8_TOBAC